MCRTSKQVFSPNFRKKISFVFGHREFFDYFFFKKMVRVNLLLTILKYAFFVMFVILFVVFSFLARALFI